MRLNDAPPLDCRRGPFFVALALAGPPHRLECSLTAPDPFGLGKGGVKLEPIDETAPPSLVPDRGLAQGALWHNIWEMGDEPGWSHFIDCQYRDSPKILRLRADGLKQCEQTSRRPNAKGPDTIGQTMACD
ncbi:MAG TPA: STY0301 family protein [Acetobacteraceae bacterium]